MQEKYFVASNSARGFCSYYDGAFETEKFSRIYLVKGGSGTGKAYLMRDVARKAEAQGVDVRYIYCSSDYESLDAVILKDLKLAILDATPPHTREPRLVGAVETVIDLGAFLNEKVLAASRGVIESLTAEKQNGFERTYKYLRAYGELTENMRSLTEPAIKIDKLKKYAHRLAEHFGEGDGREEHLLASSIGMKGTCTFDTYRDRASAYLAVSDMYETAHRLLAEVYGNIKAKKTNVRISHDPIMPDRLDALCDMDNGFTVQTCAEPDDDMRIISMRRFLDNDAIAEIRSEYRAIVGARNEIHTLALNELAKIGKIHFLLEKIYASAMDFDKKEKFTADLCNKILKNT